MVISEKTKDLIEFYDQRNREENNEDVPLDEENIEKTAYQDTNSAIYEFWEEGADLGDYADEPWLYRLLRDVILPLKETFLEKRLAVSDITLLSMGSIRITVTV